MWKLIDEVGADLRPGDYLVANCADPANVAVKTVRLPNAALEGKGLLVHVSPIRALTATVEERLDRIEAMLANTSTCPDIAVDPEPAPAPDKYENNRWYVSVGEYKKASAGLRFRHNRNWYRFSRAGMSHVCGVFQVGPLPVADICVPKAMQDQARRLVAEGFVAPGYN